MPPELTVRCHPNWLWKFNALLQKGVQVKCLVNRNLLTLLTKDFHLDNNYINRRIQTITLDGQPVDDLACALATEGATLAISGAMPGLAGATLRKGGFYAAMRGTISHCANPDQGSRVQAGNITIKLFNLILKDQSEAFLSRGVGVPGKDVVPIIDDVLESSTEGTGLYTASLEALDWSIARESYQEASLLFFSVTADLSTCHRRENTKSVTSP